jgi:sigma-B regulation protein RsbU (phosphoserine phosphatase)
MPKLIGTDGSHYYSWNLTPGRYVIGRSSDCNLCIPDKTVSRSHAELEVLENGVECRLMDLGSHNGTSVNGRRISTDTMIKAGDHIVFGQVEFRLTADDDQSGMPTRMSTTQLSDREPEKSIYLSMNEALKPLPQRVADIPELLPTLFDMAKVLVVPEPREVMLQKALAMVAKVIPAERLAVLFVSENQEEIYAGATLLMGGKDPGTFTLSRTIIKDLLTNKNAIVVGNPADDPHFALQQSIIMSALKSAMAVPLFDGDRVLGILYVDTTNPLHRYSDEYLRLLATFGNIIASRLVNFTLMQERELKHALEVELRRASMIQKNLLPRDLPEAPGYLVHAFQRQSRSVGGDLYDVTVLPDGRLLFYVADVSGKGMGAALLMSNILASFRILYADADFDLKRAVEHVSVQLQRYSAPEDFATLFIGVLDKEASTIAYINAGHNPPLLVRRQGKLEFLQPSGMMIGAFDFSAWTEQSETLTPGDLLFIFTDGVTEAMKGDEQYSDQRLEKLVVASRDLPPDALARKLVDDIDAFVGDAPQSDDITLLILKRADNA